MAAPLINVPPNGTYGARQPGRVFRTLMSLFDRVQVRLYRRSGGTDRMTRMWDFPVVLLTTKGARSGLERTTALGGFPDGDDAWLVVAVGISATTHHPSWFLNMVSNPDDVWVGAGTRRVKVRGQLLLGEDRTSALQRIASISPRYGKYQAQTDREIPIVRLTAAP